MSLLLKDEFRLPNEPSTRIQWPKKNKAKTKSWNNTNSDTNRKYQKASGRESILCLKYNTCREGIIPKASYGRVWRYQKGNQNTYIEEEQTTQWPKEKVQKDKRSTKHTYKTKDRVTRTPLKTGGELRCSGRVSSSCATSDTRRVNLVTNPVISHEWGKDREVFTTSGTYPWSFVTQIFHINSASQWNIGIYGIII
jgi:hypothetical protein